MKSVQALRVSTPKDLNRLVDLSIDDALAVAMANTENGVLPTEWYEPLLSKLSETGQNVFTMGLAAQGIRVKKAAHLKQALSLMAKYKIQVVYDDKEGFYAEVIDKNTGKMVEETDEFRDSPGKAHADAKKIIKRLEKKRK